LMFIGIFLGFQSEWVPFDDEMNRKYRALRLLKWLLTAVVIIALASHYLIV